MPQAWSQSQISPYLILSNNNLTATKKPDFGSWQGAVGTKFFSSENVCWEIEFTSCALTNNQQIGIANSLASVTDDFIGDVNSLCSTGSGQIYCNGALQSGFGVAFGANDRVQVALSRVNNKIWWRNLTAASGWNGDIAANQDPASNTGGFPLPSGLNDHAVAPAAGTGDLADNVDSFTGFFDPRSWLGTPPSGFMPSDFFIVVEMMVDSFYTVPPSPTPAGPNMETSQLTSAAGIAVQRPRGIIGDPTEVANFVRVNVSGELAIQTAKLTDELQLVRLELKRMNLLLENLTGTRVPAAAIDLKE